MADIGITKFRVQIPRDGATPSTPGFAQSEGQDPVNPPGSPTGIYVPYLGATGAVNLGEFGLLAGNLVFDTTPTNIPTTQGTMYWDDARQTVALIMNGTTQHVGQDQFIYVKNSSGTSIPKGRNVRNSGTDGGSGHILIEPFLADGTHPSETYLGVTSEEIPNGGFGQVMAFGELGGVNTNSYTAGAFLYVSTTVAGQFQTTEPVAPNNIILVGRAINSKNNGDIFIRPHIGSNINNDEGVKITSGATGDLLQLQAGGLWENKSLATIGIPTGSGASGRVTFWTGANTQGSDAGFLWNNNLKKLSITGFSLTETQLSIGSLEFQSFTLENGWFGQNVYFDGSNFRRRSTGSSGMFYFFGKSGQFRFFDTGNAGTVIPLNDCQFKVIFDGRVALGGTIAGASGTNSTVVTGATLVVGPSTITNKDAVDYIFGTSTGTKIGTATTQKLGFWNATPIVQPTTAVASATLVGNAGTNITDTDTFDGYTLAQIVKALRNAGLLA